MAVAASCNSAVDEQSCSLKSIQRSYGMKSDIIVIGSSIAPLTSPLSIGWDLKGYLGINVASINYLCIFPIPSGDHFRHKPLVTHRVPWLNFSLQNFVSAFLLLPSHPMPLYRMGPSRLGLSVSFLPQTAGMSLLLSLDIEQAGVLPACWQRLMCKVKCLMKEKVLKQPNNTSVMISASAFCPWNRRHSQGLGL